MFSNKCFHSALFSALAMVSSSVAAKTTELSPEATQALQQLNDIALPEPISWWPLAFSWWILLLGVISILIGIAWYFIDLKRRNVYRKEAQQQLEKIMQSTAADSQKIQSINSLLKQVALTAYGRKRVAELYHQDWIKFLAKNANYIPQPAQLESILTLSYSAQNELPTELKTFYDYAQKWIKGHHQ